MHYPILTSGSIYNNMYLASDTNSEGGTVHMGHISVDVSDLDKTAPDYDDLLILPTRNLVLFPGVNLTIRLGRESSVRLAEFAERTRIPIGVICQTDPDIENPSLSNLFEYGVVANVIKVLELPDGQKTALLLARGKFHVIDEAPASRFPGALAAHVKPIREPEPRRSDIKFEETVHTLIAMTRKIIDKIYEGPGFPFSLNDSEPRSAIINNICTNLPLNVEQKFQLLEKSRMRDRATMLLEMLDQQIQRIEISKEIMDRAHKSMEENQRNAFLHQQMEAIRDELYGADEDDASVFADRAALLDIPDDTRTTIDKEIAKLRRLNPQSPDYSVQYSYLDLILSLPWDKTSELNNDFAKAEKILADDHYALEKVKERIIEQMAMIMDNPSGKAPILCLVGPPGVGKTSIGKSIARALGREYQRVALGGLHDEAEIRGHRRTYIGAMPGRIIDAMKRAGTSNPVLMLDEIDKIGADYKGDPSAALLEVLDPEQNVRFHDNYVDIDFDLSKVLFIATANSLSNVSRPLLDRIEIIEIPGYIMQEKREIAKRHLLPRIIAQHSANPIDVSFKDEAIEAIIDNYTSESGVRQLEKQISTIFRKAVLARLRGKDISMPIGPESLRDLLGIPPFRRDRCSETLMPGVATGLAWTQVGGEILLVEVSRSTSKNGMHLTLTGNLGDVMKESATIALQWVKANAESLGIDAELFEKNNVHIHFPEGAIPKDGPSAGITMVTALVSSFTDIPVRGKVAMTGEITLRGQVLPVGGIREKFLAARRAGATDIIVCEENRRDVDNIPSEYLEGLTIHYVSDVHDVIKLALAHPDK